MKIGKYFYNYVREIKYKGFFFLQKIVIFIQVNLDLIKFNILYLLIIYSYTV